jgi:adenylate kinase
LISPQIRKDAELPKVIIVLGPPGSGKGTQCQRLAQILNLPHISTGDLLRHHVRSQTEIALNVSQLMHRGELVPDEMVMDIVRGRLGEKDWVRGMVLDGFPRTENQARLLDTILNEVGLFGNGIKWVFRLVVPENVALQRLANRQTCASCGKSFTSRGSGIRLESRCDVDGTPLSIRDDDRKEAVKNRLQTFERKLSEIVTHYSTHGAVVGINADRTVEQVTESILSSLGCQMPQRCQQKSVESYPRTTSREGLEEL